MTYPPPPTQQNILERGAAIIRSLNLTNVLILALIVVIAIPSYFAYRFMVDVSFRREFMSGAVILAQFAPCVVMEGHRYGNISRHSIFLVYGFDDRIKKLIGLRAPGTLNEQELVEACKTVVAMAEEIKSIPAK